MSVAGRVHNSIGEDTKLTPNAVGRAHGESRRHRTSQALGRNLGDKVRPRRGREVVALTLLHTRNERFCYKTAQLYRNFTCTNGSKRKGMGWWDVDPSRSRGVITHSRCKPTQGWRVLQ